MIFIKDVTDERGFEVDPDVALAAVDGPSGDNELNDAIIDATIPITRNKINPIIKPMPINKIRLKTVPLVIPSSKLWLPKKPVTKLPTKVIVTRVTVPYKIILSISVITNKAPKRNDARIKTITDTTNPIIKATGFNRLLTSSIMILIY